MRCREYYSRIKQDIRSAMLGLAIGDALGVPVEFIERDVLARDPVTGYRGYGSHDMPAGTWSDDTSMALASLDSLSRGLDADDMMRRFCNWWQNAAYTATDTVFDIGISTSQALRRYRDGMPALSCGGTAENQNGNGPLMRILPAVLYCMYCMPQASLAEKMAVIQRVSCLTHAHPRSQMACGIYAIIAMELLGSKGKQAVAKGLEKAKAYYQESEIACECRTFNRLFKMAEVLPPESEIASSGYVVSSLEAALWCLLTASSYSECVLRAVNLGDDTDTVGAIAGSLAGILWGRMAIPDAWYDGLLRKEQIEMLCEAFIQSIPDAPTGRDEPSTGMHRMTEAFSE